MMSQCVVPSWNLIHQRQEQVEGEEGNRSPHVHTQQHPNHHVPMSNYEVTELTWENGQLAMHGLGGLVPTAPAKPTWVRTGGTLESVVHQATCQKPNPNLVENDRTPVNINSFVTSSAGKWADNSGDVLMDMGLTKKRLRSKSGSCQRHCSSINAPEERADRSACASASATFCRDTDTTMMTWASFESPGSLKTKTTEEDSACQGGLENPDEEERETKTETETGRSHSTRRSRAAAVHNQSERRRRDRINQKMKALQKLVPNSSKIDKASMLDEVIEYMKQLKAQVQMMSVRNIPQMMMPLGMQQQLQMSLLARMGMGMGLGMGMGILDMNAMARTAPQSIPPLLHHPQVAASNPTFVPPPFIMPPMMPAPTTAPAIPDTSTNPPIAMQDPYCALLTQSMNIDLYNKMAALYRQQVSQTTQVVASPQPANHVQRN